jgi:carboxyl-terminal processing protease
LGEKTFGKGSVQSIFPLGDVGALKLTVAKYYTPSHRVIHEHGIEPDIVVPMTGEQEAALLLTRSPVGLEAQNATNGVRSAQIQDVQLERADDLLKGILLYGQLENAPVKMAGK